MVPPVPPAPASVVPPAGAPTHAADTHRPPVPDFPPRWPAGLRAELRHRWATLSDLAGAWVAPGAPAAGLRVVDLSFPEGRHLLTRALNGDTGSPDGAADLEGGVGAVVSAAGLARFADLGAAVAAIGRLLAPTGQLLAVEPGHDPGMLRMLATSLGTLLPAARGAHLARDLPATLRANGFEVADVERFSVPTLVWPLRPFAQVRALPTASLGFVYPDPGDAP